jgi:hypothetical protein
MCSPDLSAPQPLRWPPRAIRLTPATRADPVHEHRTHFLVERNRRDRLRPAVVDVVPTSTTVL